MQAVQTESMADGQGAEISAVVHQVTKCLVEVCVCGGGGVHTRDEV